jgi:16S rRNA (cytosine967-C5)-methyltransferase
MKAQGKLVASDVVNKRLENIRPRLQRAGVEAELVLIGQNGGGLEDLNGQADLVFVDAPCSGSGTWRRRPEDAWRLTAEEVEKLHGLQVRILSQATKLVKPGGRLVYVTCSMLARENEASVDAFEAANPDFRPVAITDVFSAPQLTEAAQAKFADLASVARLRLSPASADTDGFFAAVYERAA